MHQKYVCDSSKFNSVVENKLYENIRIVYSHTCFLKMVDLKHERYFDMRNSHMYKLIGCFSLTPVEHVFRQGHFNLLGHNNLLSLPSYEDFSYDLL